jgi:hypothetical protein
MEDPNNSEETNFDPVFAAALIGKVVLIGVTVHDRRGNLKRQEQCYGLVSLADPQSGIAVSLQGQRAGQIRRFPPATNVFQAAPKGRYRLRSTGEVVVDPDFTATWILTQPDA